MLLMEARHVECFVRCLNPVLCSGVEVYNGLNVIHQAEGPHPRRWPRADAWTWLQEWAAQEGLRPDGPEGVTVGPYGAYEGSMDKWDISRCFMW